MKIYLSGRVSNDPEYMEHFEEARRIVQDKLNPDVILNPTILPGGLTYAEYMQIDFAMLQVCDTIVMLEGWRVSPGATAEHQYAVATRMMIINLEDL